MQVLPIVSTENERGFDDATPRFDPRDLPLHHGQFRAIRPGLCRIRLQRRKMNSKLLGSQLKPMQFVHQREA